MPEAPLWSVCWDDAHRQSRLTTFLDWDDKKIDPTLFAVDPLSVFRRYSFAVAKAISAGWDVPADVRAEYEERIMRNGIAPEHAQRVANTPATALVNKKGKPFSWSPSAISDFMTCPAQYAARRFYETLPYVETEAMRQGTIEHKHLEDRLAKKVQLPEGYTRGEKYCIALEKATATAGTIVAEQELAISEDMKFVSWFDKKAWGRCKIDVTALVPPKLTVLDWKSGKIKDDLLQLKINTCFLAMKHPEIEVFTNRFVWLKHDCMTPKGVEGVFTKEQVPELWDEILGYVHRMQQAWRSEMFQPRSSGLCRSYCAVTSCTHCGKGSR